MEFNGVYSWVSIHRVKVLWIRICCSAWGTTQSSPLPVETLSCIPYPQAQPCSVTPDLILLAWACGMEPPSQCINFIGEKGLYYKDTKAWLVAVGRGCVGRKRKGKGECLQEEKVSELGCAQKYHFCSISSLSHLLLLLACIQKEGSMMPLFSIYVH